MVFYDNFAKPSPSKRSMSIEGTIYYDKHSPTKESCFSPAKQKPLSPQKIPQTPTRVILKGTSQPSLSPSKSYVKHPGDLPFRDFPTKQVTPTQLHKTNTLEFSTLEGLIFPSFELSNHGSAVPLNDSTSSINLVELDKPITSKHSVHQLKNATDITVTSWSNLDFCIAPPDSEPGPVAAKVKKQHARKTVKPKGTSHVPTTPTKQPSRDSQCEISSFPSHSGVSRPPESPMRRLVRRISQNHINSAAGASKKYARRLSLGQTEHVTEENRAKSFLSPKSHLRKQVSAIDLSTSSNTPNCNKTISSKMLGKKVSLNHSESDKCETHSIASPKSPLKKQVSAMDLSTPDGNRSCFPRWRTLDTFGDDVVLSPRQDLNTLTNTKEWTSPTKKSMQSPRKQISERLISSPKWVNLNKLDGRNAKKASIPKVSSVQILLSEFDKIMELP
jgi:hypothetical protein